MLPSQRGRLTYGAAISRGRLPRTENCHWRGAVSSARHRSPCKMFWQRVIPGPCNARTSVRSWSYWTPVQSLAKESIQEPHDTRSDRPAVQRAAGSKVPLNRDDDKDLLQRLRNQFLCSWSLRCWALVKEPSAPVHMMRTGCMYSASGLGAFGSSHFGSAAKGKNWRSHAEWNDTRDITVHHILPISNGFLTILTPICSIKLY